MALDSKLRFQIEAEHSSAADFTTPSASLNKIYQTILGSGVAAGQADRVWSDRRPLAASATEDLDLAASLTDSFGATITFARIKALLIAAAPGNTNNVVAGAASSNPWTALLGATGTLIVRPGTVVAVFCGVADAIGYAVTAGTGDLLKIANSGAGTGISYDIAILGCSA